MDDFLPLSVKPRPVQHRPVQRKPTTRPKPNELPCNVKELQALVVDLFGQVEYLKRMLFGRRSEKRHDDPDQTLLFGRLASDETPPAEEEEADEEDGQSTSRRPRKRHHGRRPLPEGLPRHTHEIHPPEEERTCPCCSQQKTIFGQEVTEELDVVPARFFVNRYVRFKYACRQCEGYVSMGALPPRPMDKGIPGPGFLAYLLTSKYADHLPLYRQQQIYRRFGLELARSTMCGWVGYAAELLSPVARAMISPIKASRKIHTDDTPLTVLDPSAAPVKSRRGYMWVYIGEQNDVVFQYTNLRNRAGPESFLKGYRGYLQADAFSGYDRICAGGDVIEVACWAHARRKFFDAQTSYRPEAERILELIGRLYAVEGRARDGAVSPERLLAWRQKYSLRRLARLRAELDQLSLSVLPKSSLGQAIGYALGNWKALVRYTEAAFLSIDNNISERQIKQLVLGRKNWIFAGSEGGAESAAVMFSLIVSCKLHDIDPLAYLRDVLMRIHTHSADRVGELIPREWKARFGPAAAPAVESAA
jgi:transposase